MHRRFRMAPTAMPYRVSSAVLLGLVPLMGAMGLVQGTPVLLWAAGAVLAVAAIVWTAFRPAWFCVRDGSLIIRWLIRERRVPLSDIHTVRMVQGAAALLEEVRPGWRIGAGGLFGTFGLLWTRKHGLTAAYLTAMDQAVVIGRSGGRPIVLTPDDPRGLLEELGSTAAHSAPPR
jgi:hypothetical protein